MTAGSTARMFARKNRRIPLRRSLFQIGWLGVIGLVLLRVSIGWHFLYQGVWKLQTPSFSAAGFLGQAKGPLAEHFYGLVPDIDGKDHLKYGLQIDAMKKYVDEFANENKLDEKQRAAADVVLSLREAALHNYLTEEATDPETGKKTKERVLKPEFKEHLDKLALLEERKQSDRREMPYEQKRIWDEQQRLRTEAVPWAKEVDRQWIAFKADLASLVPGEKVRLPHDKRIVTLEFTDRLVTYTNIAIGACLIAGLFTRFSAAAGALFLLQIVLAQPDWPGMYPAPHPSAGRSLIVNKEFVEMMALAALALLPTGRWAGLDFFVHNLIVRPLMGKKGSV